MWLSGSCGLKGKVKLGTAEKRCPAGAAEQRYTQGIGYLKMYSAERLCGWVTGWERMFPISSQGQKCLEQIIQESGPLNIQVQAV